MAWRPLSKTFSFSAIWKLEAERRRFNLFRNRLTIEREETNSNFFDVESKMIEQNEKSHRSAASFVEFRSIDVDSMSEEMFNDRSRTILSKSTNSREISIIEFINSEERFVSDMKNISRVRFSFSFCREKINIFFLFRFSSNHWSNIEFFPNLKSTHFFSTGKV